MTPEIKRLYPFTPQKLDLNGLSLSYLDEGPKGPKGAHTLVMLHGNPTWSFYYRNLVTALSPDFRVIVPDHMGCGLSDKPQDYDYSLKTHIDNLSALIEHLGIEEMTLVMHDWGGAIGMGYAVSHRDKIKSLVIFNTAAFTFSHIPFRINICRIPVLGEIIVRGFNGFVGAAVTGNMATAKPERFTKEARAGYLAPYDSWASRIAIHRFVRDIPIKKSHKSYSTLKKIENGLELFSEAPALVIWGKKDWCFDERFLDIWRGKLKNAETYIMEEAGHFVVEDAHEKIVPLMRSFLSRR
ncbi:Haloalkane dehalogenase-like protein [hydrothermal vent metagenome]|uniref:Haloalkane dehalogenase-like protein n=1 Tax=hydrothermal vent metagenome TaxID=652676 RepID=A0A3B1CJ23_9ZZZZ